MNPFDKIIKNNKHRLWLDKLKSLFSATLESVAYGDLEFPFALVGALIGIFNIGFGIAMLFVSGVSFMDKLLAALLIGSPGVWILFAFVILAYKGRRR